MIKKNKWSFVVAFIAILFGAIGFLSGSEFDNMSERNIVLTPDYYYELPSGGYIYVDDCYIRYNENSFDGVLDYQITLNYVSVESEE